MIKLDKYKRLPPKLIPKFLKYVQNIPIPSSFSGNSDDRMYIVGINADGRWIAQSADKMVGWIWHKDRSDYGFVWRKGYKPQFGESYWNIQAHQNLIDYLLTYKKLYKKP